MLLLRPRRPFTLSLSLSLFQGNSDGHRQGAYREEFLLPFFFIIILEGRKNKTNKTVLTGFDSFFGVLRADDVQSVGRGKNVNNRGKGNKNKQVPDKESPKWQQLPF